MSIVLHDNHLPKQVIQPGHRSWEKQQLTGNSPLKDNILYKNVARQICAYQFDRASIATLITLGFVGFFGWDELSALSVQISSFMQTIWWCSLKKRKNNHFREGSWVYIAASHSKYCFIHLVRKFLTVGNHRRNDYLFHRVTLTNSGYKLGVQRLSYSRAFKSK